MWNRFTHSTFKYVGLEMKGREVLAGVAERESVLSPEGWERRDLDEQEVHQLLSLVVETIQAGGRGRKVVNNRTQLEAAFNAIRTYKAQNDLPLEVRDPCV